MDRTDPLSFEPKFPENRALHHLAILYTWQGISSGGIPLDLRAGDFRSQVGTATTAKTSLEKSIPFLSIFIVIIPYPSSGKEKEHFAVACLRQSSTKREKGKYLMSSHHTVVQIFCLHPCLRFFAYSILEMLWLLEVLCFPKVLHRRPKLTLRGKGVMKRSDSGYAIRQKKKKTVNDNQTPKCSGIHCR